MLLAGLSQLQVAETLVNEHVGLTLGRRSRESCQVASSDLRTAFRQELPKPRPPRSSALKLRRLLAVSPRWVLCHSAHPQRWMRRFASLGGREGAKPKPVMGWYPADADQIPPVSTTCLRQFRIFLLRLSKHIFFQTQSHSRIDNRRFAGMSRAARSLSSLGLCRALTRGLPPAVRQGDASALKDARHFSGPHRRFHSDSRDATYKCPFFLIEDPLAVATVSHICHLVSHSKWRKWGILLRSWC